MKAGSVAAALAALCALGSRALPQEPVSCGPAPTSQSSLGGIAVSDSSDIWAVGAYNDSAPGAPSLSIGMGSGGPNLKSRVKRSTQAYGRSTRWDQVTSRRLVLDTSSADKGR